MPNESETPETDRGEDADPGAHPGPGAQPDPSANPDPDQVPDPAVSDAGDGAVDGQAEPDRGEPDSAG